MFTLLAIAPKVLKIAKLLSMSSTVRKSYRLMTDRALVSDWKSSTSGAA